MLDTIAAYINANYGSRRGLLNHIVFRIQDKLGLFRTYRQVDWHRVNRFIFICHGNICRSPLADAVVRQQYQVESASFGLDCMEGSPADPRAIEFASSLGIDLSKHRSRHIKNYRPLVGDLVVCMEPLHLKSLHLTIAESAQISLVGLWMLHSSPYVHDPYMSETVHFQRCEQHIVDGVQGIMKQWQSGQR